MILRTIQLLILLAWLGCGVLGAVLHGVTGFVAGLACPWLFFKVLFALQDARERKGPEFPPCANGVCARSGFMATMGGPKEVLYTCRCGGQYVLYREGFFRHTRFDRVKEGGVLERYMVRPFFSYWQASGR